MKYISYLRVSTDKQGKSGLGLEAQRNSVLDYVGVRGEIVAEYVEIESGKISHRTELNSALKQAKDCGAILIIAKLDRLARNVAFIANLLESNVEVVAADMPEANRFMFHIMAAVAEQEGKAISERTRAALKAAKARGVKLGWANPKRRSEQLLASLKGAKANSEKSDEYAALLAPVILDLKRQKMSLRKMAAHLNSIGAPTSRGAKWHATTVKNLLLRCGYECRL
jgi:DNA invertase Pin-like site-specific DNA recombinase